MRARTRRKTRYLQKCKDDVDLCIWEHTDNLEKFFARNKVYSYTALNAEQRATIYVNQKKKHMGIGGKLYAALEEALRAQHILNLNACIGYPQNEDEYLTKDSEKFHQTLGYRLVGTFHDSGYKFGRWYDMIWMEKMLGEHTESPASVIPFSETEWAASHR